MKRIVLLLGGLTLVILIALAYVSWRPILIAWMRRSAVATYREAYLPRPNLIDLSSEEDWALSFGGRSGLPSLEDLTRDASIMQDGRERTGRIRELILRGDHLQHLESKFANEQMFPAWPIPTLWRYIYEHDRAYRPNPSVGPAPDPAPRTAESQEDDG